MYDKVSRHFDTNFIILFSHCHFTMSGSSQYSKIKKKLYNEKCVHDFRKRQKSMVFEFFPLLRKSFWGHSIRKITRMVISAFKGKQLWLPKIALFSHFSVICATTILSVVLCFYYQFNAKPNSN